jgi:hypothetical protein
MTVYFVIDYILQFELYKYLPLAGVYLTLYTHSVHVYCIYWTKDMDGGLRPIPGMSLVQDSMW